MVTVQLNQKTQNPFYGLKNCLNLYHLAGKGNLTPVMLNSCWEEVKTSKEKKEMFFSLLFSIGDITARSHNIFKGKKVDSGGNAQREAFMTFIKWLKTNHKNQFTKFLKNHLFNEFSSFDVLLANRVKTEKKKKKVIQVIDMLEGDTSDMSDYIASVIKGSNPSEKYFLAKFLTRPRLSKRKGHKTMLPQTRSIMKKRESFLKEVCEKAGLSFIVKENYIDFKGYYDWRKQYLGEIESVMFSSKKILEFGKVDFMSWLDKLPASARFRVRCRLLSDKNQPKSEKWKNLPQYFLEWEAYKSQKQSEVRVLEEKIRQNGSTTEDTDKLLSLKKEARVTVGANNFTEIMSQIIKGTIDKVKIQPFLDKVNLPYNTLVFVDDSGSMNHGYNNFTPFDFATFMATICLTKNPDDTARSLVGFFSSSCRLFNSITSKTVSKNSLLLGDKKNINEKLIIPENHFLDNLKRFREFAKSIQTSNSTNISSIPDKLNSSINGDNTMKELLMQYPIWTIISDGNFNNLTSPEASVNDMLRKCEIYFGFRPYLIVIDVSTFSASIERYQGINNFMYLPPNPAQIEQILTNFKDIEIMDVYTPLKSLYESNRYELIRKNTI